MRLLVKFLSLLLLLLATKVKAQERSDYQYIDSLSYHLYLNQNWKRLKKVSKSGFKNDIDYYYLRMRAGIAYYETGKYLQAQKYFIKALAFNELDEYPVNYLFYSSLLSGNTDQAKYLYDKFNRKTDKILAAQSKPVSEVLFYSAYALNTNSHPGENIIPETLPAFDGYQVVTNSFLYNSLLLKHDISPAVYLTHSFGMMNKNNYYLNAFQGKWSESLENKLTQYQYYASLKIIPANTFFLTAGFHYINYSSSNIIYREINSATSFIAPGFNRNNMVGDLAFYKSFWLINAGAGLTWSNLNDNKQFQQNYTLTFYPLGNLNLYLLSRANLINEKQSNDDTENYLLLRHSLGFKVIKNLWLDGTLWSGKFKNVSLNEGYLVMNGNETITAKYDISLMVPLNKIQFGLLLSKTDYYTSLFTNTGIDTGENNSEFNNLTFSISIKWKI